jgi:hypothetical protein
MADYPFLGTLIDRDRGIRNTSFPEIFHVPGRPAALKNDAKLG